MHWSILSLVTFLPLVGALFILSIKREDDAEASRNARNVALLTTLTNFVVSLNLLWLFKPEQTNFQFIEKLEWIKGANIYYALGVDGISIWFVVLSAFLSVIAVLASWNSVKERAKTYMVSFLILETMMIGMFCALDLVLFYVFFEGVLIPMFLIIGIWGGENRLYASFKFFLYTLLGSVLMLLAIIYLYVNAGTSYIPSLSEHHIAPNIQTYLWLAMFASFAVKVPMWPVHTWLPDAHVEAPTAGSIILAGVLLKMGGYGMMRFMLPLLPDASHYFAPMIYALSIVAIIYTSLVAFAQEDIKKLIAYSSIAHMGFVTIGIFAGTPEALEGAIYVMLCHGVVAGALFYCVGVVYQRRHSRQIKDYGGLVAVMPKYATFFVFFAFASIGLPGTGNFIGEILVITGTFKINAMVAFGASLSMILGAGYMLYLTKRFIFGVNSNPEIISLKDITPYEFIALGSLALLAIVMGVNAEFFIKYYDATVKTIIALSVG